MTKEEVKRVQGLVDNIKGLENVKPGNDHSGSGYLISSVAFSLQRLDSFLAKSTDPELNSKLREDIRAVHGFWLNYMEARIKELNSELDSYVLSKRIEPNEEADNG